jgi:penicillin-binding protein 1A
MVRQELISRYGEEAYTLGLKVHTTLNSKLQVTADHALQSALHEYDERHGFRGVVQKSQTTGLTPQISSLGDCKLSVITAINANGLLVKTTEGTQLSIPWQNTHWVQANMSNLNKPSYMQVNNSIWVRQLPDESWALSQIPAIEGAFVALNPHNGAILALSGGFDFLQSKYNRAVQSKRQPGSGFKPFIYTTALEKGYTLASIINDAPIVIEDPSLENDWRPENYTRRFQGPIPLRVALRESINLASIRILMDIGIADTIATAMRFGFEREQMPGTLSLALGSGYASPLKMAEAYAVFANGGYAVKPYLIERIEDPEGHILFNARPETACPDCQEDGIKQTGTAPRVISAKVNFLMNSLLRDVVQRGTATQAKQLGRDDIAGKTGTTNDQRDAWFNGFTADVVASAWVGFDNSAPLGKGETGGRAALPMWINFMRTALDNLPENPLIPPEGIVSAYINPQDGLLNKPNAKNGIWEFFSAETVPTTYSSAKLATPEAEQLESDENLF